MRINCSDSTLMLVNNKIIFDIIGKKPTINPPTRNPIPHSIIVWSVIIRSISYHSLNRSFILSRFKLNTMSDELKIICPVCEKSTELITLKFLEINDVPKEELEVLESSDDLVMPEMSKPMYDLLCATIKPDLSTTMAPTISRIKSHRTGLLKKRCSLSDLTARVFLYYFIDHNIQFA